VEALDILNRSGAEVLSKSLIWVTTPIPCDDPRLSIIKYQLSIQKNEPAQINEPVLFILD